MAECLRILKKNHGSAMHVNGLARQMNGTFPVELISESLWAMKNHPDTGVKDVAPGFYMFTEA